MRYYVQMPELIHNLADLGAVIRSRRQSLGLTQERLAALADLSRATVNELESGVIGDLGIKRIMRVLEVIGGSITFSQNANITGKPVRNGLKIAAKTASVSYRSQLPPNALAAAVRSGKIPTKYRAHFATLLDEAPIPVVVRAVEESFVEGVPRNTWHNIASWANEFKSHRNAWR